MYKLCLNSGYVDYLLDMRKGDKVDVVGSLCTFGGYDPSIDTCDAYLEDMSSHP